MGSSEVVINQSDAAYLAGLIDGDGSIRPAFLKDERRVFLWIINIKVSITQRPQDADVLNWVKETLQTGYLHHYANHNQVEWEMGGSRKVRQILPQLLPYLKIKKQRALWALEIINSHDRHTDFNSFLAALDIAKQMRLANSRKPKLEYINDIAQEVKQRLSITP